MTVLYLVPLAAVVALIATGRTTLLQAGLVGLALTVPAALLALGERPWLPFLAREAVTGAWIAWPPVAVIFTALLFYQVVRAAQPEQFAAREGAGAFSHRRLFAACFLLGPFAESAMGFGVGTVIALAVLVRMGLGGAQAVALALFSQTLVPWGALAIGTTVGAEMIGVPAAELGLRSAMLCAVLMLGHLLAFWAICRHANRRVPGRQKLDDVLWMIALVGALYAANLWLPVEVALLAATGPLMVLRYLRDARPSPADMRAALRIAAPYVALTLVLLATRLIEPLGAALRSIAVVQPMEALKPFAILHHMSFWLLVTALGYGAIAGLGPRWSGVLRQAWTSARPPMAVTLVFIVMAQLMAASGIAAALAEGWVAISGPASLAAVPLFGAGAGFLTGANVASNAMLMPLQVALAERAGADTLWIAAVQNVAGSMATMFSPVRVAMGCALLGLVGAERVVYSLLFPAGGYALFVLIVAVL